MTPFFMESNREDSTRKTLDQYGAAVKELAKKYGTVNAIKYSWDGK